MKRLLAQIGLAVLAIALLFWPVLVNAIEGLEDPDPVSDPVTITDYRGDLRVDADGRLTATERIKADFPSGRHGIFRFFDVADPSDPNARLIPELKSISVDGEPATYGLSWEKQHRLYVVKIGDAATFLSPGSHTYVISYTIDGALSEPSANDSRFASRAGENAEPAGSTFSWNVVAQGWQLPIRSAEVIMRLPSDSGKVQCTSNTDGTAPCKIRGAGTREVTVSARNLKPQTPVTVRIGLAGDVPPRVMLPWSVDYDAVFGRSTQLAGTLGVLSLLGLGVGLFWWLTTTERSPGFPVLYEPPEGLGPVQTAYISTEAVPKNALSSTLVHQAERGLTTLSSPEPGVWEVVGQVPMEQWATVDPVTRRVGEKLGVHKPNGRFVADGSVYAGKRLSATNTEINRVSKEWARSQRLIATALREYLAKILVVVAAVVAAVGYFNPFDVSLVGLPFAAFVVGAFGVFGTGVGTRRTKAGREVWSRRRFQAAAVDELERGPVRLLRPQGLVHRLHPVRDGVWSRQGLGEEVPHRHRCRAADPVLATGLRRVHRVRRRRLGQPRYRQLRVLLGLLA